MRNVIILNYSSTIANVNLTISHPFFGSISHLDEIERRVGAWSVTTRSVDGWKQSSPGPPELPRSVGIIAHSIHVWHIYTYIYHKDQPNVGTVNIPYMDPVRYDKSQFHWSLSILFVSFRVQLVVGMPTFNQRPKCLVMVFPSSWLNVVFLCNA